MRTLSLIACVMTALGSMGASAQTMGGIPARGSEASAQRATQKASCERDARLIYRNGRDLSEQWLQQMRSARRAYVQECMTKAGFTP
ncbi:hypothetical protein DC522_09925 [Microvirga sp. KLBC 81]|nr:hypothetical protein DC522_09925 [Microvirga sp. KLBC 81]